MVHSASDSAITAAESAATIARIEKTRLLPASCPIASCIAADPMLPSAIRVPICEFVNPLSSRKTDANAMTGTRAL